ncbi:serine hydrolase domain-containing protein [Sphingobacterium corticis]|uniref:Serine hydrolase domain-containing protein n=1 Tax=Sphingobacterium corticis TaxID=1812823 RepID=A0ABW5NH38_9SPHI
MTFLKRTSLTSSVFAFFLCFNPLFSQQIDTSSLNTLFDSLEVHQKFMGNVAVSKNGQILYARSVGYADVESSLRGEELTKYRIGSISKTFTAVLIMKAVEQGKVELDQTISSFFPTITNADSITIRQLLSHRSGIHSFTDDPSYPSWLSKPKSESELIKIIEDGGSDFKPNSKFSYSNSNYVLLTFILQSVFKKPYGELVKEYITNPLDLNDTYLGGKINVANRESKSYRFANGWKQETETDMSIPLGAGAIVSTATDLTKFADALFAGELLSKESLTAMSEMVQSYGLGLIRLPYAGKVGLGHTGGIDGFSSLLVNFPDEKISYALVSNGDNFGNKLISEVVLSVVFGKNYDMPSFSNYVYDPADLDQYVGNYSSKDMPLKISITQKEGVLYAQATGQSAFPLDGKAKDEFKFDMAGIVLKFEPTDGAFVLVQNGRTYRFEKDN